MAKLTDEILKKIMPHGPGAPRRVLLPFINQTMLDYGITSERRIAAFLATLAVESGELKYLEEIASGAAYEGRKDLGNTQKGDGVRFKGRGLIQITGRSNYQSYTNYLKKNGHLRFVDLVAHPGELSKIPYAVDSAAWFFAVKIKANPIADSGDFLTTQIKVNGRNKSGYPNHWKERNNYWIKALSVLPDDFKLDSKIEAATNPSKPQQAGNLIKSDNPAASNKMGEDEPKPVSEVLTNGDGQSEAQNQPASSPNQTAENITNVSTGDKTVPDNFIPQQKSAEAPPPSGTMAKAKAWVLGLGLGVPSLAGLVETVKGFLADGTLNVREVVGVAVAVAKFVLPYAVYLAIAFVIFWGLKELFKQISFMLEMYNLARPDRHDVKAVPTEEIK